MAARRQPTSAGGASVPSMPRVRSRAAHDRGQSLVEFALVLPIFLVLVFGIMEFGFAMMDQIRLNNAANDGARVGAVKGGTSAQAIAAAQGAANSLIRCPLNTPTTSYSDGSPNQLTVTVTCAYAPVTPLGAFVNALNLNFTFTAKAVMRVES